VQLRFVVPYFSVSDPRLPELPIPVAARGTLSFSVEDYRGFVKVNRLINFTLEDFKGKVKDAVVRRIKGAISNAPFDYNFPLVQIERKIEAIGDGIRDRLRDEFATDFGVNLKRFDLSAIEVDKEDGNWQKLQRVTAEFSVKSLETNQENAIKTAQAQSDLNLKNMQEMQSMNSENLKEQMRIQREEMQRAQRAQTEEAQYAQHLQSQQANMGAFATGQQADVLKVAAQNLGQMGSMDLGGGNGGFNPAGMMTGMMMGGAMGQQMAGMVNNMGNAMNSQMQQPQRPQQQSATPPPMPQSAQWMAVVGGSQAGPFAEADLRQLVANGHLTKQTYVWKAGMANWELAGNVAELASLFQPTPPPIPGGMPPVPGNMPPMPPTL